MRRHLLLACLSFALIAGSNPLWNRALAFPTKIKVVNGGSIKSILVPDWEQMGFSAFSPIASSGSVKVDGEIRSWKQGQTPDQYLQLGDVDELRPDLLTLEAIEQGTKEDQSQKSLAEFPLAGRQAVARLAAIVPGLGNRRVKDVPPLKALIGSQRGNVNQTVNQAASNPQTGQLTLNQIDLSPYPISSIPNLGQVPLGYFEEWNKAYIKEVTGLKDLPLASYPMPLLEEGEVARIDAVWGTAEKRRNRTVSGGYNVGFKVPCKDQKCPYIELDDLEEAGRNYRASFEGLSWISGKYQKVSGGSGCLKGINGGKEPTGRHPYGQAFKVSVEEPDEATNTVNTALYFRFKSWCGATPYFVGPVPFLDYQVNNGIFLGRDKESSGEFIAVKATTSASIAQSSSDKEVEVERIAAAIAKMSEAAYGNFSPLISDGTHRGRLLGRYGFLSYAPAVVQAVSSVRGGQDWLNRAILLPAPDLEAMKQYFPPALQEQLLASVLKQKLAQAQQEIDPQTGEPFAGSRLVERVAQKYAFGDGVKVDGESAASQVQSFGQKVRDNYLALQSRG
jgi:hypothetical protein